MKTIGEFTTTGPFIMVGSYLIRELEDGTIWIESPSGEAMQMAADKFEQFLDLFFKEMF